MKIAVLGTGMVGDSIGSKLIELGHEVKMGSRTAGNEKAKAWISKHKKNASEGTFEDAAKFGELVFNCTNGMGSLEALKQAGAANLKGKVMIDISNPLDFSKGMPPSLSVCNTSSLGEEIQKSFPEVKVVKALNTLNCSLMVNPGSLAGGDHNIFICGNDEDARNQAKTLLGQFGWKGNAIIDLGDITAARGTEMILPIWLRLMGTFGSPAFNFKIVRN
jgi:hypothetical protein